MLYVAHRQVALEFGDGGVGVGQLLLDRQRLLVRRSAPRPACRSRDSRSRCCCGVIARSTLELGDGGVGVGQLLPDRQRLAVGRQGLGRLARLD